MRLCPLARALILSGLPVVLQDGTYSYVYGLGLISQTDNSGNQSYFLGNGLGSTEALVDGSGDVVATYEYDVYGAVRSTTGGTTEYRFTGQQDDADLGYTYLRARYYDQATGRFLSKDPFAGIVEDAATLHHYSYAHNDPTNLVDPSGRFPPLIVIAAAAWALLEIGSSAVDAYTTASTLLDPDASTEEKASTTGLFAVGLVTPGGGYATVGKQVVRRFGSFADLKRALGSPGAGNVWHHVVEQCQTSPNRAGFRAEQVQNTLKVVPIPKEFNQRLNALYSSKRGYITGSPSLTVRDWLGSKSWEEQYAFGLWAIGNVRKGIW